MVQETKTRCFSHASGRSAQESTGKVWYSVNPQSSLGYQISLERPDRGGDSGFKVCVVRFLE
jgi:hypothetical protein